MSVISLQELPDGYLAIPLVEGEVEGALRIGIVVRRDAEPIAGQFVSIATMTDGRLLLGCLLDSTGRVHRWLEIAIQDVDRAAASLPAAGGMMTNRLLDERWRRQSAAEDAPPFGPILSCGWEHRHPRPIVLDLEAGRAVTPIDAATGEAWRVCDDDGALTRAGLPNYNSSLHRYLWLPNQGDASAFVPLTTSAPTNERCRPISDVIEGYHRMLRLNAVGGLMRVRDFQPVRFEGFLDLLSGVPWTGIRHGRIDLDLGEKLDLMYAMTDDSSIGDGWLFQGVHGKWGRLVETMHLKLRALSDAISSVHEAVRITKAPLLNIDAEHFCCRLGQFGNGLPFLWSAGTQLAAPGEAVALPISSSDQQYFLRTSEPGTSIFQPESATEPAKGVGTVRLREIMAESAEVTVLSGTMATQERLRFARNDLVWLRMELRGGNFDLFVRLDEAEAMAAGEWRFRSVPLRLNEAVRGMLNEAVGVPIANVRFELLPLLSTPHDLYACAVLAVRSMLVDADNSLPVALDEIMSLARQLAVEYEESVSLRDRVEAILMRDPRWMESLGPQRLTHREIASKEALDLVPTELWCDTLGMMVRMFPGLGPDSICRDFADAPLGGIHRVFEPVWTDLGSLLRRTRSLIVIDWRYNREISSVIRRYSTGLESTAAGMMS